MAEFHGTAETYRAGSRTLERRYLTSAAVLVREWERVFGRAWLCVGREEELADPGCFRVVEIGTESLLVLRDRAGRVRAYHNVCRHRGARLCEEPEGRLSGSIQCPYHAWTYGLDGRLLGAPHMREAGGFDPDEWPLRSAEAEAWHGLLFVRVEPGGRPLAEAMAPLDARVSPFELGRLRRAGRVTYDVAANWKLVLQNYSECLHCPVLHPGLTERSPYESGHNDLVEGAILGGYMELNPGWESLTVSGRTCAPPVGELAAEDRERVYYYSIFPNLLLSLHPDYVMTHTLWPRGVDRTEIVCEWLFTPDPGGSAAYDPEDAVTFWDRTNREDWAICERVQRGVSSRAFVPGPYSPRESLPAAWDRHYLSVLEGSEGARGDGERAATPSGG